MSVKFRRSLGADNLAPLKPESPGLNELSRIFRLEARCPFKKAKAAISLNIAAAKEILILRNLLLRIPWPQQ